VLTVTAPSGIYCGPLRLLAHEIYEKLNTPDTPCSLITGQTKIIEKNAKHTACTIEMADLNRKFSVCVIDEIQMIGSVDRGWAWTRAFLGIQADEV
jgi:ATP-dependent RNA helicase SUPV3L1/SUV3